MLGKAYCAQLPSSLLGLYQGKARIYDQERKKERRQRAQDEAREKYRKCGNMHENRFLVLSQLNTYNEEIAK